MAVPCGVTALCGRYRVVAPHDLVCDGTSAFRKWQHIRCYPVGMGKHTVANEADKKAMEVESRDVTPSSGDNAISINHLTKDYGRGRGIFDINLTVAEGETVGFLGANGAGKTVTMRSLMGFIKPDHGEARIFGRQCFDERAAIQRTLGYLPGEVSCPERMTGMEFITFMAHMRSGAGDGGAGFSMKRANDLIERFELDPIIRIGRMSKGTKQKVSLVCAFMGAPRVLLLDEPTSGLDPLMQERFVELLSEERRRGTTILLSSHMFPEVERSCDRVAFIRAGHVGCVASMAEMQASRRREYTVTFVNVEECERYCNEHAMRRNSQHMAQSESAQHAASLTIPVAGAVDSFVKDLARYRIADIVSCEQTLEDVFMHIYGEDGDEDDLVASSKDNSVAGEGTR